MKIKKLYNKSYRTTALMLVFAMVSWALAGCGGSDSGGGGEIISPSLISISPEDGLATISRDVVLTGIGFSDTDTVSVGGTPATCSFVDSNQIDCTFPDNGGVGARLDVTIEDSVGNISTLPNSFTYTTIIADPGASYFCITQSPTSTVTTAGVETGLIYGQVYVAGQTDASSSPVTSLKGQLGYGADGDDPTTTNFIWIDSGANSGFDFAQNNDEHEATLIIMAAGTYDYAYRFSQDEGLSHTYCDTNGSDDGYAAINAGDLTVN